MAGQSALDDVGNLPIRTSKTTKTDGIGNGQVLHNKLLDVDDLAIRTPGREPSPQPTHLTIPGSGTHTPRILTERGSGYEAPKFEGKAEQKEKVMDLLEEKGFIPGDLVEAEADWFYNDLGIDDQYFQTETVEAIASNMLALYAGKVAAYSRGDGSPEIKLNKEHSDHALYIDTSKPGISVTDGARYEQRIDAKYLNGSTADRAYRLESFRALNVSNNKEMSLRCYFVYLCEYANAKPAPGESRLDIVGEKRFLQKATENTKQIYQEILDQVVLRTGPVIEYFDIHGTDEKRLVVAYKQGTALGLFSALSDLYHWYGMTSTRKYVEQFSNGYTVMSLYLKPVPGHARLMPTAQAIRQIVKEVSLLYCIPQNKFQHHFISGQCNLQETIYAHCVWVFVTHFLNRLGSEYHQLARFLDPNNSVHQELLSKLKKRLRSDTFTTDSIWETINNYPDLVHALYLKFAKAHYPEVPSTNDDFIPTLSYLRLKIDRILTDEEVLKTIEETVVNENDMLVMKAFHTFNQAILKTNFFTPTKVAISFRLNPNFLPSNEYPQPLFGMFLVIGSEFRGFHLRFRDIARGGIRIVKSRNKEAYNINARSIFDENYNLANTQQRKNKDIPEGGSKGVVLLDWKHQDKQRGAFEKYIDSILDLLLRANSPGIKDPIVDLYGMEEILFMGPDENTADLVDWATLHARDRGAPWWKSFFTGKSPKLGGIPHDKYGMTTLSVRQYVEGIYRKLNLDPTKVKKLQTGGPDGDLGSNEILLGHEQYTAIVDGAGVLVDPQGLDREELVRLAKARVMISQYDISKLSKDGYRVLVDDTNIKLPSGETITNGTAFRNTFHLRKPAYEMFVPCGGRPESIDLSSAARLIDAEGKSLIPYIVEGANLFLTQDAKLRLEKAGCILYKDASANKGGVTSSSLEVLAALALDDKTFIEHMCMKEDGTIPQFYQDYVKQVQRVIKENATLEFEAIWREHENGGGPRSVLSDTLSVAITKMDEELQKSTLWDNVTFRHQVLSDALPNLLLEKIGLETILKRVPDNYLRAIFGSYLASRFIYKHGINASQVAFFQFMNERMTKTSANGI